MDEYEQNLNYLAQFAQGFIPIEKKRCCRFEEGLRLHIRHKVTALRLGVFKELRDIGRRAEHTSEEHRRIREEKVEE